MKNLIVQIILCGILLVFYQAANASTTIDFDDVSSMTVIDNHYSGLGIIFSTSGDADYSDGHAYARQSSYNISTPNILSCYSTDWLNSYCIGIATFSTTAREVGIYALTEKPYSTSWAWMKVYDSSGTLLDTVQATNSTGSAEHLLISRTAADISYVEFMGKGNRHVYFDNMTFSIAPEPVSSTLFIIGGSLLAALRYLRKKQ